MVSTPEHVLPPPKRLSRRITEQDAQFIAKQVARGLTETHAVQILDKFTVKRWWAWKGKLGRAGKMSALFSRLTALRMDNLVENIEDAATGRRNGVRHDWRAAQFLASVVDERFRSNKPDTNVNVQVALLDSSSMDRIKAQVLNDRDKGKTKVIENGKVS
jgi:hypothetical protein